MKNLPPPNISTTLRPFTLLAMLNAPRLGGKAQEGEDMIVQIMKKAVA